MCGISGIVGQGWTEQQLRRMLAAQHHRGPDDSGTYVDATRTVGLAHNRLSIIDLSEAGHQPMANADGSSVVVFNGEIYNFEELRAELGDHAYRSRTDTEVLLAAYERWGPACVEHFIGMFAFAIWDVRARRLFCARDRLGIKPFHYAQHDGCFLFASEVKAILAAGHPARPDPIAWATYLAHGQYDPPDATFFAGVASLPPGHTLTLEDGRLAIQCYWDLPRPDAPPLQLSDDEAAASYLELVRDSIRLRLRSDVPVGVNLSGGLDSSSLMLLVDEAIQAAGEIQSFTVSFDDPRYDEQDHATEIPRSARWARHVQRIGAVEAWELSADAVWHQEAPFGGISTLAYHRLHRRAREHGVTVLLEGQGVDEMLAGYAYHQLAGGDALNVYQDGTSYLAPECLTQDVRALVPAPPAFPRPYPDRLTNMLYRDLRYTKLPRVLRMNDRLSMAFGRELREPFLDHRVVELAFRLPATQKVRDGQGKWLLRHAMKGRLPDHVRLAGKRAVVTPQREWLRTTLRAPVEEILGSTSFAQRGLFDVPAVHAAYRQFCDGAGENAFHVWQWVNTELWFRRFIDPPA